MDRLTSEQAAIIGAFTGYLCGPFSDMHAYIERIMGRPVWTHEMADKAVMEEIRQAAKPDFLALCPTPRNRRLPMTHPLTPREKVELKPCPFCGGEAWLNDYEAKYSDLPPKSRCPQCRSCGASLGYLTTPAKATEAWNRRTALASGSGDHAELERLKAAISKSNDEICQSLGKALGYPWFKDDQRNFPGATEENGVCVGEHVAESIADEAASRISALLAENAALRDERDALDLALGVSKMMVNDQDHRATEAERKLAEAVGLLRDLASWFDGSAYNGAWVIRSGDLGVDDAICAARTFLSKEAERG